MSSTTQPKRFIILGDTGAGKSSFINFLYNYYNGTISSEEIFCAEPKVKLAIPCANWVEYLDESYKNNDNESNINDQTKSQTQCCKIYNIQTKDIHLELIDTPGFNDTNGVKEDEINLKSIEDILAANSYINGLIIIINGSNPRTGVSFKSCLHMFFQIWPTDLLKNAVAILTNCDEISVNFDLGTLEKDLQIDLKRIFYIQNSLFRWNPKNASSKLMNRIRETFELNLDMIPSLMDILLNFSFVSTDLFKNGATKIALITKNIYDSIKSMMSLIEKYKQQEIAANGVISARHTMKQNQQWEKHGKITAITYVEMRHKPQTQYRRRSSYQEAVNEKPIETSMEYEQRCNPLLLPGSQSSYYRPNYMQTNPSTQSKQNNLYDSSKNNYFQRFPRCPLPRPPSQNPSFNGSTRAMTSKQKPNDTPSCQYQNSDFKDRSSYHRPYYRAHTTKIQVTIPDNEAVSRHQHAQEEERELSNKFCDLDDQRKALKISLQELKENLKQQVTELHSINQNYNILEKNRDELRIFKEILLSIDRNETMKDYYDEIVAILSKKSD